MATSYSGMALQMEESLRKAEVDELIKHIAAAQTPAEVALLLAHFVAFPRVIVAVQDKLVALKVEA